LDADEASRIGEYLRDKGLIKFVTIRPQVAITDYGIDYVENALAEPEKPTALFPPVNILRIGQMVNSQIQQGT
jgi:hypothetical protein